MAYSDWSAIFIGLFPNTRQKSGNSSSIVNLENEEDENLQDEEVSHKSKCNHSMSDRRL